MTLFTALPARLFPAAGITASALATIAATLVLYALGTARPWKATSAAATPSASADAIAPPPSPGQA